MANLLQKLIFRLGILCYHCWCWRWKSKVSNTLYGKYLDHMLVIFEQNRMVRTIRNFLLFDKKWLTIFDKVLTPFWKTFLWLKQLFDAKIYEFNDYYLSVFQKLGHSNTCNQVKSCTKHGRPNQSQRKLTVALQKTYSFKSFSRYYLHW